MNDDRAYTVTMTIADCDVMVREFDEVHAGASRLDSGERAGDFLALERPGGDASTIFTDARYANGSILRFGSAGEALLALKVHRAAGYDAELMVERDTYDPELDEELPPDYFMVTGRSGPWTTTRREN
jgi:hypothetical protein